MCELERKWQLLNSRLNKLNKSSEGKSYREIINVYYRKLGKIFEIATKIEKREDNEYCIFVGENEYNKNTRKLKNNTKYGYNRNGNI